MMKKLNKFLQLVVFVMVYTSASLQTVYAEDTEIFFAPADDLDGVYPNIMFIIDSSGSMGWGVSGTTDSRMEVVQDVMDEVLTNITNVNAGLMRFNNGRPGPIIYPVLNIDKEATPTAFQSITAGGNDGDEAALLGVVDLTSDTLEFNGNSEYVGLRFEDLNIPQGATIISANVVFTADRNAAGAADVLITGENVDSAPIINTIANSISSRNTANSTATSQLWTIEDWTNGDIYSSPDISGVVQEITDRVGWCGGNDLMLFFHNQSGASRNAYSKEGIDNNPPADANDPSSIFSPRIKVTYSQTFSPTANKCMTNEAVSQISSQGDDFEVRQDGTVNATSSDLEFYLDGTNKQQGVGLVFKNIKVPQGASIQYAYIAFTADENSVGDSDVDIFALNLDTIVDSTDYPTLIFSPTTGSKNWYLDHTADPWITGNVYRSPDLSSIINTITSRPGWALDNSMGLVVSGNSGRHVADSFSGNAAKLHIGFKGVWQPGVNTIRDDLKTAVAALTPSGGTPISGTYAEAGSYFKGDPVFYGASRNGNRRSRVSHPLSYTAAGTVIRDAGCLDDNLDATACASEIISGSPNYVSPITDSCQTNHIVFLTDGSSNSHLNSTNTIYSNWSGGGTCSSSNGGNDCSIKMAAWLNTNDIAPAITGKQIINTHMIGFGPSADPALMKDMATAGGGGYYSPTDRAELINDISSIVNSIANVNTTFVTSGVTVNQYNRLTHNEELYFSLFTPQSGNSWPGNIKRYRLLGGTILDANSVSAIDPLNSEFKDDSQSFWSGAVDGNDVELGGTAEQLTVGRKLYSNVSSNDLVNDGANAVRQTNTSITAAMLGGVTAQRRDTIMYWAQGYDVNDPAYIAGDSSSLASTPARKDIGDPLHSQPTVIQYNDSTGNPLTTRIYVGTNHGYLHSFDADNGKEKWAFIPKDLLSRLNAIVDQSGGTHSYGLDGSVAISLQDLNGNGAIDPGENAALYIGQRRGGKNYYAIDISNPDSPKLMFKIAGGSGAFGQLAETWSTPTIGKMNLAGVNSSKLVMIFGGGYDDSQDTAGTPATTDATGKAVFIVDALSGSLLWNSITDTVAHGGSAGPVSSMNSVPSQVTAFDLNDDDLIDHLYVTDTKAQVFRFDVDNSSGKIKGGRIAKLNGGGSIAENRRFYYSADTALIRQVGDSFVSVSIGSGYRAHPLDLDVTDHFFVLKDKGALSGSFDMDADLSSLQDVTSLVDADGNGVSDAVEILNNTTSSKKGWYINFNTTGEKVIERSITFNNAVIFTSYIPPGSTGEVCQAAAGGGRLYALNILNGNPFIDTNYDGSLSDSDRYVDLVGGGIAPPPQVLLEGSSDGVTPRLCIGTECGFDDILPPISDGLMGIKWRRN